MNIHLKDIIKISLNYVMSVPFYVSRVFSVKKDRIVFSSYWGKGYGDNCKAICEELLKRNVDCEIIWILSDLESEMPNVIKKVKLHSLKSIYYLSTAKIWVDNTRKPLYVRKRATQYYINSWHGTAGFKRTGMANKKNASLSGHMTAMHDSKLVDLYLSNCLFRTNTYITNFQYTGEIMECGAPRNDVFFKSENSAEKVCDYFNIDNNSYIVLYAPTFRSNGRTDVYMFDTESIIKDLRKKYNKDVVVLIRLHPNIAYKDDIFKYSENIINASQYPDISELLITADMLISDYSSVIFDMILLNKPIFLFTKDLNEYQNGNHLFEHIRELPFPLAENSCNLISLIDNFDEIKFKNLISEYKIDNRFIDNGTASEQVVDRIINLIDDNCIDC